MIKTTTQIECWVCLEELAVACGAAKIGALDPCRKMSENDPPKPTLTAHKAISHLASTSASSAGCCTCPRMKCVRMDVCVVGEYVHTSHTIHNNDADRQASRHAGRIRP